MRMRAWVVFGLGLSALHATPVSADILPPDSAPETCTVDLRQTDRSECLNCWGWQDYPNRCSNLLAPYCFIKVCQAGHAYSWGEVLCRAKVADAPAVPADVGKAIYTHSPSSSAPDADGLLAIPATCAPYTPQTTPVTTTATATSTQSATSPPTATTTQSATQSTPSTQTSTTSSTDTTTTKSQGCASCSLSADKGAIGVLGGLSATVAAAVLVALRRRRRR